MIQIEILAALVCLIAIMFILFREFYVMNYTVSIHDRVEILEPLPDLEYQKDRHVFTGSRGIVLEMAFDKDYGVLYRVLLDSGREYWFDPAEVKKVVR